MKKTLFLITLFFSIVARGQLDGFGDSNTYGQPPFGPSTAAKAWINLVGSETGNTVYDYGIPQMQVTATDGELVQSSDGHTKKIATFFFGNNDAYFNQVIDGSWRDTYKAELQKVVAVGYSKVIVITPVFPNDSTDHSWYEGNLRVIHDYEVQVAASLSLPVADLYSEMQATYVSNINAAYHRQSGWYNADGLHIADRGHRMLADLVEWILSPIPFVGGEIKSFGAGSLVTSTWRGTDFVEEAARETGRKSVNHGTIASMVNDQLGDTLDLMYQRVHAMDGVKDYAVFWYDQNGGPTPASSGKWISDYTTCLQSFISAGYQPSHLILCTLPISPQLSAGNPGYYAGMTESNLLTPQVAAAVGARVMDCAAIVPADMSYFLDIVHINDLGHRLCANALKTIIGLPSLLPVKFTSFTATALSNNQIKVDFTYDSYEGESFSIKILIDGQERVFAVKPKDKVSGNKYSIIINLNQ